MKLSEVKNEAQFKDFYDSNGLLSTQDKINRLKEEMGIKAIIYEGKVEDKGLLDCLQQQALELWDRISCGAPIC